MSKIVATADLSSNAWSINIEDLCESFADLYIGVWNDSPVIEIPKFRVGYELRQDDNVKEYGIYPKSNGQYNRTDQDYLVIKRLRLKIESDYELYVWAEEKNGNLFEQTIKFTTPRPEKPFDSWLWDSDNNTWVSPVEPPDDEVYDYEWNEETQSWDNIGKADHFGENNS